MTGGFCVNWTNERLKGLEKKPIDLAEAFKGCADFHYRFNQMDRVLEPYVGDLKGFLAFLEKDLGWAITVSDDGKTITADECKEKCVCPVSAETTGKMSGMLCNCSAWYAKRMFSKVCQQDVQAVVKRSVLRGGKSCIYEITIPETFLETEETVK